MSTKINRKKFTELIRTLIQKEIKEVSTTATAGGEYDTPNAFQSKGNEKRNLPAITKIVASITDKIKITTLTPFAIFLLLVFANHESKTKISIKITIPKKTKFIY